MEQILRSFTLDFFGKGKHKILPDKFFVAENCILLDVRSKEEAGSISVKRIFTLMWNVWIYRLTKSLIDFTKYQRANLLVCFVRQMSGQLLFMPIYCQKAFRMSVSLKADIML
jgi:hypothetical protein